jgi:ribosomal-protein-alanine N-acetyltransferase
MRAPKRLQGQRIYLDALNPQSLSEAYLAWMKDPQILKYISEPKADYSLSKLQEFVKASNESPSDYLFGIFLNGGQHIGNIKIGSIHPRHKFADLGIIIGEKKLWGQGFATEAIRLSMQFAFNELKLHKLFAGMVVENEASYRRFVKAGFEDVGCYKKHFLIGDRFLDGRIVEIFNPNFDASQGD